MRDLFMLAAMVILVPLAFSKSFNAYLLWGWTAMLAPNFYLYGFMQSFRYNLIFAAITLLLWAAGKMEHKGKLPPNSTTILLFVFTFQVTISATFGYSNNPWNWQYYETFLKSVVFALLIPVFVTTRLRLHALVVIISLALGFHGVVEGLKFLVTAGSHRANGLPSSMMSDNNHFAVGMCMVMPLFVYLITWFKTPFARLSAMAGLVLTLLTIIGTNSRGGFIGLAVLAIWHAATSRRKVLAILLVISSSLLILQLAPESWFDRIASVKEADSDASFMGRVGAWKISLAVAMNNPLLGGGLHAIQSLPVWQQFVFNADFPSFIPTSPMIPTFPRAAHSIYFEILGDLGFVGLGLFLALIVNAVRTANHVSRMVASNPEFKWARDLANSLKLTVIAYSVAGAGVSLGYFEFFYVVIMLIEALRQYVLNCPEISQAQASRPQSFIKSTSVA